MLTGAVMLAQARRTSGRPAGDGRTTEARRLVPQQSTEDRGFSLTLVSPTEAYLVGWQVVGVEPVVPAGDLLEQADFFVNGKLAHTDRSAPYAFQIDFGNEIRQQTIVVRARTLDGRQARVSFISRSADITDSAAGPIVVVPAVVRDASGRPVTGLTVSDFSLLEDGIRQSIVHFDSQPAPVSVLVALYAPGIDAVMRSALLRAATAMADDLPGHHALAFVDGVAEGPSESPPELPAFSHRREAFQARLEHEARSGVAPRDPPGLAETLTGAARGLATRRGGRALVLLTTGGAPRPVPASQMVRVESIAMPAPFAAPESPHVARPPVVQAAVDERPNAAPSGPIFHADSPVQAIPDTASDPQGEALRLALAALRDERVTVHVIVFGADPDDTRSASLRETAEATGGEFVTLGSPDGSDRAFRRIAESLLHRYLISYQPRRPADGISRTIDVRVRRPNLKVQAPRAVGAR